jgi:hypothetical protein
LTWDIPAGNLALVFPGRSGLVYVAVGVDRIGHGPLPHGPVPKFVLTSFALAFFATVITLEFFK